MHLMGYLVHSSQPININDTTYKYNGVYSGMNAGFKLRARSLVLTI